MERTRRELSGGLSRARDKGSAVFAQRPRIRVLPSRTDERVELGRPVYPAHMKYIRGFGKGSVLARRHRRRLGLYGI
jgi:hypothetical protein